MPGAGLGDRALPAGLAGAVLRGARARRSSSACRAARTARSRRSRRPARRRRACRSRAGSAAGRPSARTARPGTSSAIVLSSCRGAARACRSRRDSPAASPARRRRVLGAQPRAVPLRPRAGGVLVEDAVAQQQLRQSLPGAHQIAADVLPRADQIAQRLLLDRRHPDRVQRVDHQQPQHPLGVALIGLDLVLRRALDLPRRRHHAPDPRRLQRPREPVPGRARLVRHPRRARQLARNSTTFAVSPGSLHERSSPDSRVQRHRQHAARVHVQTSPAANLRHGSALLPYGVVVDRRGRHPRCVSPTARHARGGAGLPSTAGRPASIWSRRDSSVRSASAVDRGPGAVRRAGRIRAQRGFTDLRPSRHKSAARRRSTVELQRDPPSGRVHNTPARSWDSLGLCASEFPSGG